MQRLLATLVLAASALRCAGLAAPTAPVVANPGATSSQGGLFAAVAAKNAELLAVKEGKKLIKDVKRLPAVPFSMMTEKGPTLTKLLEREGCVGVPEALTLKTAATLRAFIESERDVAMAEVEAGAIPFEARFGGVNCRGQGLFGTRQDLYLPVDAAPVRAALNEFFTRLRPLLEPLVGVDATLHEISSLVADPGAPRQCIHADTIVLPCPQYPKSSMAPLYTCFIALQDVEDAMGPTLFLLQTHQDHTLWNVRRQDQETYISSRKAVQSGLKTGDVAIFDSRVLHSGLGNTSDKRRILFYCTVSSQRDWPLPGGLHGSNSVLPADRGRWRVSDFLEG